jgi:hypothetical protein
MTDKQPILRGPQSRKPPPPPPLPTKTKTIGVHCWPDTIQALEVYARSKDLLPSGAAHVLLREALGLPPITTT